MPVTADKIEDALAKIAAIIAEGDEQYLPIFMRLERELEMHRTEEAAISRAKKIYIDCVNTK